MFEFLWSIFRSVAETSGLPPLPDFRERVLSHANKAETESSAEPSVSSRFNYDPAKDRLSFANVEVIIKQDDRMLQCATCGQNIKQNLKKPREFYSMEKNMKRHILHKHFNVWEFRCAICTKGFNKITSLKRHIETGCQKMSTAGNGGSGESGGQIHPANTSNEEALPIQKPAEDEKMEEGEEQLSDAPAKDDENEGEKCAEETNDD